MMLLNREMILYVSALVFFSLHQCAEACSYPGPTKLQALRETTQCVKARGLSTFFGQHNQCSWQVSTNESNQVITLTVEEMPALSSENNYQSSCLFNQIIILDGNHIEANSAGHWCGPVKKSYITSGQHAYVYFRSAAKGSGKEIRICYKAALEGSELPKPDKTGTSAIGMFGYIILGWVVLLIAFKLTWDRFKGIKGAIERESASPESCRRENLEPRIDLSIISVAPPPYDQIVDYPDEDPPPYVPRRACHSDVISGSQSHQHRIVFDNFILTRAPPPSYRASSNAGNSIDGHRRSQMEASIDIRMTNEER